MTTSTRTGSEVAGCSLGKASLLSNASLFRIQIPVLNRSRPAICSLLNESFKWDGRALIQQLVYRLEIFHCSRSEFTAASVDGRKTAAGAIRISRTEFRQTQQVGNLQIVSLQMQCLCERSLSVCQ